VHTRCWRPRRAGAISFALVGATRRGRIPTSSRQALDWPGFVRLTRALPVAVLNSADQPNYLINKPSPPLQRQKGAACCGALPEVSPCGLLPDLANVGGFRPNTTFQQTRYLARPASRNPCGLSRGTYAALLALIVVGKHP